MLEWIIFSSIGIISGLFSGLLGLGGGVVVVPALLLVFNLHYHGDEPLIQMAIATSLMTIIVTSLSSIYAHQKQKNIDWDIVVKLFPGLILGGFLGAFLATMLSSQVLQNVFALYLFIAAALIWLPIPDSENGCLLNRSILFGASSSIATISALVGIGGGSFIVPYLVMAKQSMTKAIGISATCGFPIAISAVLGFIVFSQNINNSVIHWNAFWGIISTSVLFSLVGARLAHRLPRRVLRNVFSLVLILISIYLFN